MLNILRRKKDPEQEKGWSVPVTSESRGWWNVLIHEPFTGAWQHNRELRKGTLLTYPTLYACINRIVSDVGKLPFRVLSPDKSGVDVEREGWALELLRHPNHYQTESQFREYWILSKLLSGNAYIFIARDERGRPESLHVLDSHKVLPMVTDSGRVFYQLNSDKLNGILPSEYPLDNLTVPATDIIHDRMNCFFHPLLGVPPIAAAHVPSLKNMRILRSADHFFDSSMQNAAGILTAPAGITEKEADALVSYWQNNFGNSRVGVLGSDVKFTSMAVKSSDSQLVEQLKYSDEQICQPFGIPPFKIGLGSIPSGMDVASLNLLYFCDAIQAHVTAMEDLLTTALKLAGGKVEIDISALLRMDEVHRSEVETRLVGGMVKTPNESRAFFNLPPVEGGDTLWGQHQDYPLGMLADRRSWDSSMVSQADGVEKRVPPTAMDTSSASGLAKENTRRAIEALMKGYQAW